MINIITLIILFFAFAPTIHAQTTQMINNASGYADLQSIETIFSNLLTIILPIAGIGLFITLLIGGFQYITSGGDPKQAQKAQSIITSAIIGIASITLIWFLFRFLSDFTGIDLFWFEIPGP